MGLFNEHSSTNTDTSTGVQGQPGPPGIGYKLTSDGDYDIQNKKLTNVKNGDADHDVMIKSQIEGYVSNKTQYLDGVNPGQVINNKAVIYSQSGSIHTNDLYLKDKNGQEVHFYNEDQDLNQCRLYVPNLKNNDSYGGRLKSSVMVTSINQTIEGKKIFHDIEVPTPTIDGHASNKAYVDNEISKISDASDDSNYVKKSGDTMSGSLIVPKDNYPIQGDLNKVISYETQREIFLSKREGGKMLQPIDMNGFTIDNLPLPTANDHACNKTYVDTKVNFKVDTSDLNDYLKIDGSKAMVGSLQMNGNRITGLTQVPYYNGEAANKRYVDTKVNSKANRSDLDDYLDINGDNLMKGNIRMDGNRILGLSNQPENNYEASSKVYVDSSIKKAQIKPAHIPDNVLKYIMDDIDQTSSEYGIEIDKIDDYDDSFHSYNKQVIYLKLIKDENDYDSRIGYNIYQLVDKSKNKYYTAAIEWLTTDNNAWSKMEIFNNITSGSILSNHTEKFEDGKGLYYTRSIVQFEVFSITTPPVYLLSTIHIEGVNPTYPAKFSEVYNIIYGCSGKLNHLDREVYDKHNAFEIDKTKMKMLVPLDMNNNDLLNVPNTAVVNIYGTINNNKFFTITNQEIILNIGPFFLESIILFTSNKFRSQQDTLIINTGKTLKYPIRYPSRPGLVNLQINKYQDRIFTMKMTIANNIQFRLIYRVFH